MTTAHLLRTTLLLGILGIGSLQLREAQAQSAPQKKARMLMLTVSKTFTHPVVKREKEELAPAEVAMTQLGQQTGLFTVDCTQNPVRDFTIDNLKKYDIICLYTQGPDLGIPPEAVEYFLNTWLKQKGHGVIAFHSATDTYGGGSASLSNRPPVIVESKLRVTKFDEATRTYEGYKPYWDMIGGSFNGHPWTSNETVTVAVHDTKHPGSKPWGDEFTIKDEIYQYKNWQPEKVRVLMSLNMAKSRIKKPYHVPVAWVKEYGQGRLFYTNLGHNAETWANPTFRDSVVGGVKWLMGLEEGDATPNPEVSRAQEEKAKSDAQGP